MPPQRPNSERTERGNSRSRYRTSRDRPSVVRPAQAPDGDGLLERPEISARPNARSTTRRPRAAPSV